MLCNANIIVFGFGAQGSAQALNLRDGGCRISVVLPPQSRSIAAAQAQGFTVLTDPCAAAAAADVVALLVPDGAQPALWNDIAPHLQAGSAVIFAHGLNFHAENICGRDDVDLLLVAPLAQGALLRANFTSQRATACAVAVAHDATGKALERAEEYAVGICGQAQIIPTTVAEEVETDLFAEQALLCGGLTHLVLRSFETMTAAGYDECIAYHSCVQELAGLVELLRQHGPAGLHHHISDTARFGSLTRGPQVIDERVGQSLCDILTDIRSGKFLAELTEEQRSGGKTTRHLLDALSQHPLQQLHEKLQDVDATPRSR